MPTGNPCLATFLNFTLFDIKTSELCQGTSGKKGREEDLAGKTRMNRTVNKKKGKKNQKEMWEVFGLKRE